MDTAAFRRCLGSFATGVTVITTAVDGEVHGMTANAFMSVSLDPPLVVVSVAERAKMAQMLPRSGRYCVSILRGDQEDVAMHFAGRPKLDLDQLFDTVSEHPFVTGAVANLSCRIVASHVAGDHTLFVGEVDQLDCAGGEPLVFHAGKFSTLVS